VKTHFAGLKGKKNFSSKKVVKIPLFTLSNIHMQWQGCIFARLPGF